MNYRKWKLGLAISIGTGFCSGLAMLGVREGNVNWLMFAAVIAGTIAKDLGLWLKDHPVDSISDTGFQTKDGIKLGLILFAGLMLSGCSNIRYTSLETKPDGTQVRALFTAHTFFDSQKLKTLGVSRRIGDKSSGLILGSSDTEVNTEAVKAASDAGKAMIKAGVDLVISSAAKAAK